MFTKRIAFWMSEKKTQKVNWQQFEAACAKNGFELFRLDLFERFESQEPFCVLLHKLTDHIASAKQGDDKSASVINRLESYLASHPSIVVLDPIERVRILLDRYEAYSIIQKTNLRKYNVFTPTCCEINNSNERLISDQLDASHVNYPFICKPAIGHGSKAHAMCIIFNEDGLKDCRAPCVAQTFVNHNAVLYKIYIVGSKFSIIERPSLKNFHANKTQGTIFFDSGDISKAGSQSRLTFLDTEDLRLEKPKPDFSIMQTIACTLRKAYGMDLLGIDVVIENTTGKYAIIDVNAYPGYDGFPDFYSTLLDLIKQKVDAKSS